MRSDYSRAHHGVWVEARRYSSTSHFIRDSIFPIYRVAYSSLLQTTHNRGALLAHRFARNYCSRQLSAQVVVLRIDGGKLADWMARSRTVRSGFGYLGFNRSLSEYPHENDLEGRGCGDAYDKWMSWTVNSRGNRI